VFNRLDAFGDRLDPKRLGIGNQGLKKLFLPRFCPSRKKGAIKLHKVRLERIKKTQAAMPRPEIVEGDARTTIPHSVANRAQLINFREFFRFHKLKNNLRRHQTHSLGLRPESGQIALGISDRTGDDIHEEQFAFFQRITSNFHGSNTGDMVEVAHLIKASSGMNQLGTIDQTTFMLGASQRLEA